jgi:transcriptional regulator with XRE-family HTH domain
MSFAYSESARAVREALGAVLRQGREALHRTLTEVAAEAGLSPAHLSEVERGRKEVSTERLLAVAHVLGVRPADLYAELARKLGADHERPTWPEDPPVKLRLATASLPPDALRSVADFSAYLAMSNPPPKTRPRIGFFPHELGGGAASSRGPLNKDPRR